MGSCTVDTPFGPFLLKEDAGAIVAMERQAQDGKRIPVPAAFCVLHQAADWIDQYFRGGREPVSFPVSPYGTVFQQQVWDALQRIPYGATSSYGEIARMIGREGASRAVGAACRANPVPILIPCHRVVGSGGQLTGYAYGLDMKRMLLALEQGIVI